MYGIRASINGIIFMLHFVKTVQLFMLHFVKIVQIFMPHFVKIVQLFMPHFVKIVQQYLLHFVKIVQLFMLHFVKIFQQYLLHFVKIVRLFEKLKWRNGHTHRRCGDLQGLLCTFQEYPCIISNSAAAAAVLMHQKRLANVRYSNVS
jgi:hypothetical protein